MLLLDLPKDFSGGRSVVWYSHFLKNFPQFVVIHTVKGFGIVNKAEIDIFLELSCVFDDPMDVGNLISVSSAFSKTSLNIWKFMVHILLKPGLENFECPEEHQPWVATGTAQEHVWLCQQLMGGPCQPLRPTPSGTAPPGPG